MAKTDHETCMKLRLRPTEASADEYEMVVYCSACDQHFMARSVADGGLQQNLNHLAALSHKANLANALETWVIFINVGCF